MAAGEFTGSVAKTDHTEGDKGGLLPETHDEFRSRTFWERFFEERGEKAFEWYGEWDDVKGALAVSAEAAKKASGSSFVRVGVLGCGNSELSAKLYDAGVRAIRNFDFSERVIEDMRRKNEKARPEMSWETADICDLSGVVEDRGMELVVDKGALDALATEGSDAEAMAGVGKMLGEVRRVLGVGGRYFCVSLLQEHVLGAVRCGFGRGWMVEISRLRTKEESPLCAFLVVATKLKDVVDVEAGGALWKFGGKMQKVDEVENAVRSVQEAHTTRWRLRKFEPGRELDVKMFDGGKPEPRFWLTVADVGKSGDANSTAIVLVPMGAEYSHPFASTPGFVDLAGQVKVRRIVLARLGRGHVFESVEGVVEELKRIAVDIFPPDTKAPVLAVQSNLGVREVRLQSRSEKSGGFVVDDVPDREDGTLELPIRRRLVFDSSPLSVQSEARIVREVAVGAEKRGEGDDDDDDVWGGKDGFPSTLYEADDTFLSFEVHAALASSLAFVQHPLPSDPRIFIVGLGGGCLPLVLQRHGLENSAVHTVEWDEAIARCARDLFGYCAKDVCLTDKDRKVESWGHALCDQDRRAHVIIGDGLAEVAVLEPDSIDALLLDADAKANDEPDKISFPPRAFLAQDFLQHAHRSLRAGGVFAVNLACRSSLVLDASIASIRAVFPAAHVLRPTTGTTNHVLIATKRSDDIPQTREAVYDAAIRLIDSTSPAFATTINPAERLQHLELDPRIATPDKKSKKKKKKGKKK